MSADIMIPHGGGKAGSGARVKAMRQTCRYFITKANFLFLYCTLSSLLITRIVIPGVTKHWTCSVVVPNLRATCTMGFV